MVPDFRWTTPMYGFDADCEHVGVPETARKALKRMTQELLGTTGLIAIYIPESTEDVYQAGIKKGRVVGGVQLTTMPANKKVDDYYYDDWDGSRRWPIGWPCDVIYAPEVSVCPAFREHIEFLFGNGSFGSYVSRFQHGPFELEPAVRERLNRDFSEFARLKLRVADTEPDAAPNVPPKRVGKLDRWCSLGGLFFAWAQPQGRTPALHKCGSPLGLRKNPGSRRGFSVPSIHSHHSPTYGSSPMNRARFTALDAARWKGAHSPLRFRLNSLLWPETSFFSEVTSL